MDVKAGSDDGTDHCCLARNPWGGDGKLERCCRRGTMGEDCTAKFFGLDSGRMALHSMARYGVFFLFRVADDSSDCWASVPHRTAHQNGVQDAL